MLNLSNDFFKRRKLENLVENQTSYTLNNAEMHVFETYVEAEKVLLQFNDPVLASMIVGRKIMHLSNENSFDFLPGESLILPANEPMCIDFPEAKSDSPTRCLAMAISNDKIKQITTLMNETMPKADGVEWDVMDYNFHFINDPSIYGIIKRLLYLFTENHPSKDFFVDNMLQELIMRILQCNSRKIHTNPNHKLYKTSRISFIVEYIKNNLDEPLSIACLSKKACMSESHFYKVFKNEIGLSPIEFINNERIKLAVKLLQNPNKKIKEVYFECGFESRSYFNRLFKREKLVSPSAYQSKFKTTLNLS